MNRIQVKNQTELDAALAAGDYPICIGSEYFEVRGASRVELWGNSQATLWENSQATLWGNSQATLWGNSQATLWGNSQATLRENSQATLWENSHAIASGSNKVLAGKYCAVTRTNPNAEVTGGVVIDVPPITTAEDWCAFYVVEVTDGVATLYKGVKDDYSSPFGISYAPGTIPIAPDWDGGKRECGGGLHFSPSAGHTLGFHPSAKRFLACPVRISEIAVHYPAKFPEKVKAKGCCAPVWEVDINGKRVEEKP